ncbi:hypothetical protein [Spiroplasma platyhelix]|nr:hypothetical protein [Spiroplasma platyhelix]MBE4704043.1 hypothetical protein [Spiroplasma platyhelix PALS-1]UJB29301.1 hypothetical protein SPLAT_v1c05370 [Spiroplasma platyhelix PALS-1]
MSVGSIIYLIVLLLFFIGGFIFFIIMDVKKDQNYKPKVKKRK